ncbi:hypothetical protein B0J11DRAFT_53961 [Dendryphion nanum]|uniref:DRBM domain-containing protein n=1 Tax=Dendryphion nanum TaxID=256645 RepID=A0A9P9II40_9PLEO|nr:hypothetical protein B0J11DRAFT_53961 [Dendryphion nanum]
MAESTKESWRQRLQDHCSVRNLGEPTFQEISDRRGGRTAWSVICYAGQTQVAARFWYDGQYAEQAKEDAAEVALRTLTGTTNMATEPPPASYYAQPSQT